jgi:YgiT-type zinc finger domain-containing protein
MIPFTKCPVCGGDVQEKEVEKIVRGGNNTAILHILADVCLHCGERLYAKESISLFEQIRKKLEKQDVSEFRVLGNSYQIQIT